MAVGKKLTRFASLGAPIVQSGLADAFELRQLRNGDLTGRQHLLDDGLFSFFGVFHRFLVVAHRAVGFTVQSRRADPGITRPTGSLLPGSVGHPKAIRVWVEQE